MQVVVMTGDSAIRWSTIAAVSVVALVTAFVSYRHALTVVRSHGESGALALAYPLTIDGLIYAASMVLLNAARQGIRANWLAYGALSLGIAATLAANVAAGLSYGPAGALVAAQSAPRPGDQLRAADDRDPQLRPHHTRAIAAEETPADARAIHEPAAGRVVCLTEHGNVVAAIVPPSLAAELEHFTPDQLRELLEDFADGAAARAARATIEAGEPLVPWEEVKAEAGL